MGDKRLFSLMGDISASITVSTHFPLFDASVVGGVGWGYDFLFLSLSLSGSAFVFQLCHSASITCDWVAPLDKRQRGQGSPQQGHLPAASCRSHWLEDLIASGAVKAAPTETKTWSRLESYETVRLGFETKSESAASRKQTEEARCQTANPLPLGGKSIFNCQNYLQQECKERRRRLVLNI